MSVRAAAGRHTGGHLVGPGSHIGGVPYVVERDVPITLVPDWIADLLTLPAAATAVRA